MSKHIKRVRQLFEKSPVVDYKSVERIAGPYARVMLSKMKDIHRLTKGCYSKEEDPSLAVFCFTPAYFGLQSALSFHGLWEQETIPVIITSRRVRTGIREILNTNVLVRHSTHIFGFDYFKDGNHYFPYSDIEKTFIDMVLFNEPISSEVLRQFKKRINSAKLKKYLAKYPEQVKRQFLKYSI